MKNFNEPVYPGAFSYGLEELNSVKEVILNQSPFRYYGPSLQGKVNKFEKEAAYFLGVKHALAVSSGTAALIVAMRSMGIGPGDEVIVPAITFIACAGSVVACRAIPVFCDVDKSINIDPEAIEKCISPRTKAIMVVHIQGVSADMDRIMEIANRHGLMVVEDCAQSFGATYKGRYVGSIGHAGTYSLQINKTITTGEGGLVVTNDEELYKRMIMAHDQGTIRDSSGHVVADKLYSVFFSENYRMNELTGAVALIQLRRVRDIVNRMHNNAWEIKTKLSELQKLEWRLIYDKEGSSYVSLAIYLPSAEAAVKAQKECCRLKVPGVRLYQGLPIYAYSFVLNKLTSNQLGCPFTCPYYKGPSIEYHMGMCPKAEDLISRALFIQISPLLTSKDINYIVNNLKNVLSKIV